jgi:hypothetical protein
MALLGRPSMTGAGLPRRQRGRLNGAAETAYQADLRAFCDRILEIYSTLVVARPDEGRELCRQAILKYVPANAVRDYEQCLAAIREDLRQAIAARISSQ